ncbi:MAG TPA: cytochrome P450 [Streptosporangiaceae bacterium]
MDEHPELSLPLGRPCPFAAPDGYDRVRATAGLASAELPGGALTWLVTRLDEARAALAAPQFSTDRSDPSFPLPQARPRPAGAGPRPQLTPAERRHRARGASLIGMDPPDHTTARRAVIGEFTARRVQALRPRIQQIVDERIAALRAAGPPADLVPLLSLPVPSQVICELLGVPYDQHEFFQARSTALLTHRVPPEQRFEALGELFRFLDELVSAQEETPGDNLLGRQVVARRAAGDYDHRDLVSLAFLLLVAGHETTASMISLGALAVMTDRADGPAGPAGGGLQAAVTDPDLGPRAVEELLRYFSIADIGTGRFARSGAEIGGTPVREGQGVIVSLLAANRDPAQFADPDRLDPDRRPVPRHVAFGHGPHQCLGQSLARAELDIVYRTLFTRLPGLRLAVPLDELPVKDDGFVYGLYELPVTW